ncbi:MAG: SH3 domain-containing protein [Aristaeellaceae bacterium]
MKKTLMTLLAMLMLLTVATGAWAAATSVTMYVNTPNQGSLNLRDANDKVIARIPYRTALEIYERSYIDSERVIVEYDGKEGYVYLRYLSTTRPAASKNSGSTQDTTTSDTLKTVFKGMKTVNPYAVSVCPSTPTSFVNLRWAPSKSAPIQAVRYNGDVLTVLAENNSWAQVYDGETNACGFMLKSFLRIIEVGE